MTEEVVMEDVVLGEERNANAAEPELYLQSKHWLSLRLAVDSWWLVTFGDGGQLAAGRILGRCLVVLRIAVCPDAGNM